MKLRRLLCFLLALSLFICGAYSDLPCGHVAAAESDIVLNGEWVFNDTLLAPTSDQLKWDANVNDTYFYENDMNFYINNGSTNYLRMYLYVNGSSLELQYYYRYAGYDTSFVAYSKSWKAYYYNKITFDNCYVSEGFYNWLCANATCLNAPCPNTDANCDNICDDCGELLSMEYWSTRLEYLITAGYNLIDPSPDLGDQSPLDYFCILFNKKDLAPELIVGETEFEINTSGDVLLTKNPQLYKLFEWENGSFFHYSYDEVSHTSDGLYLDPNQYVINNSLRVLYSNHSINNRFVYNSDYDPFGCGSTVGGGSDREQATRFDIDVDTYDPIGGLPADPEYGSGRVDVVVSPSAPPLSVPVSPTATPVPSDPVVTPSPDPSEPNSIIIQNQITNIGENIAALPEKLGDKIAGAIKGLFVPSENDFIAIRLKWNLLLEERFGAVYESTAIIDSIVDTFEYSGDMSSIKFPAVTVDLAGTPFTFGGWDVEVIPEGFKFLVSSVKLIVSIVCTVLFVNAMRKKLEGLINR